MYYSLSTEKYVWSDRQTVVDMTSFYKARLIRMLIKICSHNSFPPIIIP